MNIAELISLRVNAVAVLTRIDVNIYVAPQRNTVPRTPTHGRSSTDCVCVSVCVRVRVCVCMYTAVHIPRINLYRDD